MPTGETAVVSSKFEFRGVSCELSFQVSPVALQGLDAGSPAECTDDLLEDLVRSLAPGMTQALGELAKSFYQDLTAAYADSLSEKLKG
jgi:hypothetical protein